MTNRLREEECDLEQHFGSLESRLSATKAGFTFKASSFPKLPGKLTTSAIETRKSYHFIDDCWRVDVVNFRAQGKTYRYLALAILAVVFCPELPELDIRLAKQSDVRLIKISYAGTTPRAIFNYLTQPHSFEYRAEELAENPWTGEFPERGLPDFKLTYSGERDWEHWDDRDVIVGFGSDDASVRLAAMLLNFGSSTNKLNMVRLETVAGYGGVSRLSAEVRFHQTESDQWPGEVRS